MLYHKQNKEKKGNLPSTPFIWANPIFVRILRTFCAKESGLYLRKVGKVSRICFAVIPLLLPFFKRSIKSLPSSELLFHGVSFSYETATAPVLEGLSLHFPRGWTGIVGANGAGKTTIMRLATGELEAGEGYVQRPLDALYCPQRTDEPPCRLDELLAAGDGEAGLGGPDQEGSVPVPLVGQRGIPGGHDVQGNGIARTNLPILGLDRDLRTLEDDQGRGTRGHESTVIGDEHPVRVCVRLGHSGDGEGAGIGARYVDTSLLPLVGDAGFVRELDLEGHGRLHCRISCRTLLHARELELEEVLVHESVPLLVTVHVDGRGRVRECAGRLEGFRRRSVRRSRVRDVARERANARLPRASLARERVDRLREPRVVLPAASSPTRPSRPR